MSYTPQAEVGKPASHPYGVSIMRTYLVSFTNAAGASETRTVEAMTAMLAVKIAHARINEVITFQNIETIVCTLKE